MFCEWHFARLEEKEKQAFCAEEAGNGSRFIEELTAYQPLWVI